MLHLLENFAFSKNHGVIVITKEFHFIVSYRSTSSFVMSHVSAHSESPCSLFFSSVIGLYQLFREISGAISFFTS